MHSGLVARCGEGVRPLGSGGGIRPPTSQGVSVSIRIRNCSANRRFGASGSIIGYLYVTVKVTVNHR